MLTLFELSAFLQNAHWPQIVERRPTFFSIAGFPHYENVLSNVYQFFFSTESPHGLGSLCTDALLDVVGELKKRNGQLWQRPSLRHISVEREWSTKKGRIDLLLHDGHQKGRWKDASTVVLIENKVYHWLANDLGDYWQFVGQENSSAVRLGIVLGLKREPIPQIDWHENWISITHLEWANALEKRLGSAIYRAEGRYLTLLLELIENIRTMSKAQENAHELIIFFRQHQSEINRIRSLQHQLLDILPTEIERALPNGYILENQSKDAKIDTWLTIQSPVTQSGTPVKYLIQYGGLTKKVDSEPSYIICAITHDYAKAERMRTSYSTISLCGNIINDRHYIIQKHYTLNSGELKLFAEHIAKKLLDDWIPLEYLWVE